MSSLLAAAVISAASILPLPLPSPPTPSQPIAQQSAPTPQVTVSGVLEAADGRLKRGCKDYHYSYAVDAPTDDWTFDITMQDRAGKGVNAQSLLGPNDPTSGVLDFRLCRWATKPGLFSLKGEVAAYDGAEQTASAIVTESFRLRKRNP